jgi:AAHS family 4-hydroxybenzoate transporter-like MFS transporter
MASSEARAGGPIVDVAEFIDDRLVGGVLLAAKWSAAAVFLAAAAAAFCASLAAFCLGRLVRPPDGEAAVEQPTSLGATLSPASTAGH